MSASLAPGKSLDALRKMDRTAGVRDTFYSSPMSCFVLRTLLCVLAVPRHQRITIWPEPLLLGRALRLLPDRGVLRVCGVGEVVPARRNADLDGLAGGDAPALAVVRVPGHPLLLLHQREAAEVRDGNGEALERL